MNVLTHHPFVNATPKGLMKGDFVEFKREPCDEYVLFLLC
jgi:hypothetical protein